MAQEQLKPWVVVSRSSDWKRLEKHLFQADGHEHGAVLCCGVDKANRRLIVRHVLLAKDASDFVQHGYSYRLEPAFISRALTKCKNEGLSYIAVHNHGGHGSVAFSRTDLASHERGYPALLSILSGPPVGALVFAHDAVAGDIWEPAGRAVVESMVVCGARRQEFFPCQLPMRAMLPEEVNEAFEAQVHLLGARGQALLGRLQVAVVGAGGAGSMILQALTHLGVGGLVSVDPDRLERSNRPRVVYATPDDEPTSRRMGTLKVDIAKRGARIVCPDMPFETYPLSVDDPSAAAAVTRCDAIFLAADTAVARHVVNAISHQYLIPTFQVGAKAIPVGGRIDSAFAVARILGPDGLCMWCAGLIDSTKLQVDALPPEERAAAEYVPGVRQPSVYTMNAMSSALALNDFLFTFTGLQRSQDLGPREYDFLNRRALRTVLGKARRVCAECERRRGRADGLRLPIRWTPSAA